MPEFIRPVLRVTFLALLAASLPLGGLSCGRAAGGATPMAGPAPTETEAEMSAGWKEVERLLDERKFRQALEEVQQLAERAAETGDAAGRLRAIVREAQITTALGGFENAVEFLDAVERPEGAFAGSLVDLFHARALIDYLSAYSWEIGQRERVASIEEAPLTAWTADQIVAEANRLLAGVWADRADWGATPIGELVPYVEPNDYPARIRGTVRDAVAYLWVELLADSSLWRVEQSSRLWALPLEPLIEDPPGPAEELSDPEVHPLVRLASVLGDLEDWHRDSGRLEAAFEARRERLERLRSAYTEVSEQTRLAEALRQATDELGRRYPWWSVGMVTLAEWTRGQGRPDSQVEARRLALESRSAHPDTVGGRRAAHLIASIEMPSYRLEAMASDAPDRRSLRVTHANLGALWLRAYKLDLETRLSGTDPRLSGNGREAERVLASARPDFAWKVDLPPTPDYRSHDTYVTPPLEEPGLYLIVASADRLFREKANELHAVEMMIGDLVVISRGEGKALEITVRSGASGRAIGDAEVDLYRYDYRGGHQREGRATTDGGGIARFRADPRNSYFVVARKDGETALGPSYRVYAQQREVEGRLAALVWTDRSVYRPRQELLFKVAAYSSEGDGVMRTLPATPVRVELMDPNWEVVETVSLTTNVFGTASGSFRIPAGRLLGGWTVRTSLEGSASVQVEEYKRPTFEVTLAEPAAALRLNRPAELGGEARYYFGLPLAGGELVWRVVRESLYPWWWFAPPATQAETIAAGEDRVDDDGSFRLRFTPEADERQADSGVTYRFRLEVEVTDEGGETRSATRSFRLGFVAVEARLDPAAAFFRPGEPVVVSALRSDLDGAPRPGTASWTLIALDPPERTLPPADEPLPLREEEDAVVTEGDQLRPRWARDYSPQRTLGRWDDGAEVAAGTVEHGEGGAASIEIDGLPAGAYRLRYATVDPFGAAYETRTELLVAGEGAELPLPAVAAAENSSVAVGETARILVHSGFEAQEMVLELFRDGERTERRRLISGEPMVIEIPIQDRHRGGFGFTLTCLRDHQLMTIAGSVFVPWDDRRLTVELASFRDLLRPKARETWTIKLSGDDESALAAGSAELLAYMYDRSLDLFAPHQPADPLALYPVTSTARLPQDSLGPANSLWLGADGWADPPRYPSLRGDRLDSLSAYGIGGLGRRVRMMAAEVASPMMESRALSRDEQFADELVVAQSEAADGAPAEKAAVADEPVELRTDFAETAFWEPHLTIDDAGTASFEFTVPDSVTEWNVWVHALTTDLRAGALTRRARTVKDLLVRPYLPRFFREGDELSVPVVVSNAGEEELAGQLDFDLLSVDAGADRNAEFGLASETAHGRPFRIAPGDSVEIFFPVTVPPAPGAVAVRAMARAGSLSDGEQRELPILPGRFHLAQSRFAALDDAGRRTLRFDDLVADDDPTRIDDQLVVTLDAQLFYSVLKALPYLAEYPYDCTEQLLNRFLSTGIVSQVFDGYPAIAEMAEGFSTRDTPLEAWEADDPNRKMALEETPWLVASRGGKAPGAELINVLDRRVAAATRDASLARLEKAQTASGGFPWWPGGPPSTYMTIYLLQGFSRALEFGVEVPREPVRSAWSYLQQEWVDVLMRDAVGKDCCWEIVTFLNYVLSSYPDEEWTGGVFSDDDRRRMLDFSFGHWREHSPLGKAQLALTLARAGRVDDARLVFDSVMDSARTTPDEGTFWAPEARSWLWYNDTIDSHAFALRTLSELDPNDSRRHGLVQWLLLNKKLNQWKSTRSTAEVLYALVHYLERENLLGASEEVTVTAGPLERRFRFDPDRYGPLVAHGEPIAGAGLTEGGRPNQVRIPGEKIVPEMAEVVVSKQTPGLVFASATWHFSTEKLPEEARGDLFSVERRFYRRLHDGREWTLTPLAEGADLALGDQLEVELTVTAKHAAEYVHLRDPRGAGFEPESYSSGFRWNLGVGWYEEIRDSGTNFFFERLPAGEMVLRYRVRAATSGAFRTAPATLQSIYAPEFTAYSSGELLRVNAAE